MEYIKPDAQIILFDADVITGSNEEDNTDTEE